ncbi:cation channel sperm-associated auxiliary subunit gamma [Rhynchocyon petersi]
MSPTTTAGQRALVLQMLRALLTVLLAPWRLWALDEGCTWQLALNDFESVGQKKRSDRFFYQEPMDTVENMFRKLEGSPVDLNEKYMGFPYYLKIDYSCQGAPSEALVRKGYLTGLKPRVLVTFHSPVNFYQWKMEQLQIQMEAAPFRSKEACEAEQVCAMSWYTPMPIKNGSVVMHVDVSSNGLGPYIPQKRFYVNINGYLKMEQDSTNFTIGNEVFNFIPRYFENVPSRPLWYTIDQSPVLILGGIPNEKYVLLTDTSFQDFSLLELNIDSCWVESLYCPQPVFTATIYDTIATESTLFIRQNQLVYYFTGNYSRLQSSSRSVSWVRVLANECIKKLYPVEFHSNGSENVMALTGGQNEGYVHFGTITDGRVSFETLPRQQKSFCQVLQFNRCSILWTVYIGADRQLILLMENNITQDQKIYVVVSYNLVTEDLVTRYTLPELIPDARGQKFLMIQRAETYTSTSLVPKGLFYNPYKNLLFVWGNFIMHSYDHENYIYLADFPKESTIKYLVTAYHGDLAIVTETEEIWYLQEGSYDVHRLFPSNGWEVFTTLQVMHQSSLYSHDETMLTLFYEHNQLYQLVYLTKSSESQLVKRLVPIEQIVMYLKLSNSKLVVKPGSVPKPAFINLCPFTTMRLQNLPNPQKYTRQERYLALPPRVLTASGFHNEYSLAIYQGLVYYLLWLHSKYDKPYADPVHDPTWRWWNSKKQDQSYYFYLASNWQNADGVYVEMESYEKIYHLKPGVDLPDRIFLDKGTAYSFVIMLTASERLQILEPILGLWAGLRGRGSGGGAQGAGLRGRGSGGGAPGAGLRGRGSGGGAPGAGLRGRGSGGGAPGAGLRGRGSGGGAPNSEGGSTDFFQNNQLDLGVVLAHPHCVRASVSERNFITRNSILFYVTIRDKKTCFDQGIRGHHLKRTSVLIKVMGSAGQCFQNGHLGPRMQGHLMLPVLIGCPPGKRLAFDITYTLQFSRIHNKHYFDCMKPDPEMPCFHFRDTFYPFFLIQDMVTGESGSFQGRYVLKVIGGGPTLNTIKDYTEEEIYHYNSPLDNTNSLIWTVKNRTVVEGRMTTKDSAFQVFMFGPNLGIELYAVEMTTDWLLPESRWWLCQENSPCYDTVPDSISTPEFFFKVFVSNRDVDRSTYCDYQLVFLLHIHGLPLSADRSFFFLIVSTSFFVGLVVLYLIICFLWPLMVKGCSILRWKINSMIASESYYAYVSSSRVISGLSLPYHLSMNPSKFSSKVSDKGKAEAE